MDEQPDSFQDLPAKFKEAFDLWSANGEKNIDRIISLLENFFDWFFCGGEHLRF